MENVFEDLVTNTGEQVGGSTEVREESNYDHTYDLGEDDLIDEESDTSNVSDDTDGGETPVSNANVENPTNAAFAQMRTQNKELLEKLNELDSVAKGIGLKDYEELIQKGKEAQIKKQAASKGIPIEVARELEEMRALKDDIISEREKIVQDQKQQTFVANVQEFVSANNLADSAVDKLSQDLENDGISIESLMDMSKSALNRILGSYIGVDYQKNLERKNAIRKELPINQSSKIDTNAINRDIDTLAKQLAGKI